MAIRVQFPIISTNNMFVNPIFTFDTKLYQKSLAISFILPIKFDIETNQVGQPFSYTIKEINDRAATNSSEEEITESDIAENIIYSEHNIKKAKKCKNLQRHREDKIKIEDHKEQSHKILPLLEHNNIRHQKSVNKSEQIVSNKIRNKKTLINYGQNSLGQSNRAPYNLCYMYILKFTKANLRLFQDNPIIKVKASELCTANEILQRLERIE